MRYDEDTNLKLVTVNRQRLLTKLHTNLSDHIDAYSQGMIDYEADRRMLLNELAVKTAAAAEKPGNAESIKAMSKAYEKFTRLEKPVDHAAEYRKAITVMEWTEDDKVELSMNDFQCYVEDDWKWQKKFRATVTNYSSSLSRS